MPHNVSDEQLAANRANAAKSTGPRTPEGKARCAQNARKHGFAAANFTVVRYEEIAEVDNLKADAVATYRPGNSQELFAVERIALAQQSILRASRLEASLLTACLSQCLDSRSNPVVFMDSVLTGDVEVTHAQNRNYVLGESFLRSTGKSNAWTLFLRYQAQAERLYRRAIAEFERLKALREELPNEPISDPQPEETEPDTPKETDPSGAEGYVLAPPAPPSDDGPLPHGYE